MPKKQVRGFLLIFILILFTHSIVNGQNASLKGIVSDANTGVPLAFVNISINEGTFGGTTDIDGRFELKTQTKITSVQFSYLGYESLRIDSSETDKRLNIRLQAKSILLNEIVVTPGINPAHRIIEAVVENRDRNNPRKLESFSYTAYDKMVMTIDTNKVIFVDTTRADTSKPGKLRDFLADRDFFILETVTERSYRSPDKSHEKVIATRISGFKDPIFTFLLSQLQSTDFYSEMIIITDKKFINPISRGSTNKYLFTLENQIITEENDTLFTISYRPYRNTNFDGLEGVITIHSGDWAIKNVIAGPSREEKGFSIKIQQLYEKVDSIHWFPVQLNTDLILNSAQVVSENKHYPMVGIGKSYLRDIRVNDPNVQRRFNETAIEVMPGATEKGIEYWKQYRIDSISNRDAETYRFMDSVGQAENLDKMAKAFETMLTGKIPLGYIDLEINRLFRINSYEGFGAGIGLHTNDKVSRTFKLGGFWGYGFKDKALKFGGDLSVQIHKPTQTVFRMAYSQDVIESGGSYFVGQNDFLWNEDNFRRFFVNRMDFTKTAEASFGFRALKHFRWEIAYLHQDQQALYRYQFYNELSNPASTSTFTFDEFRFAVRFAFREKFMQTNRNLLSLGTDFPIVCLTYTNGKALISSDSKSYNKFEFMFDKTFRTKYYGNTHIQLQGGLTNDIIPATKLFYAPASFRSFSLFAPGSFATMRMNEFLSDRYLNLFITHDFGKLIVRKGSFKPEFALALNAAIGDLQQSSSHSGIDYKTLNQGFYEGGLLINNLLRLPGMKLGVGTFYRFGPYAYPETGKNFGYKFTMQVGL
jgi:hypothetical protein